MSLAPAAFAPISDIEYMRRSETVFAAIESAIDRFLEKDVIDIDASRTGGLLELAFPNGSKVVLNTQPPLRELWLAARAGGYHFRRVGERWLDTRSERELFDALSACASEQAGIALRFTPPG